MRLLADRGLRVPEEVAVIGVDDIEDGRFSVPSLSTVRPDKEFLARTAVRMLGERLGTGERARPARRARRLRAGVRGSTAGCPAVTQCRRAAQFTP